MSLAAEHPTLSLLQWNVGNADVRLRLRDRSNNGLPYSKASASRLEDLDDIVALILYEKPHFVTLQEMDVDRGHHERLVERLGGYRLAAAGTTAPPTHLHAQAVLVRSDIEASAEPLPPWDGIRGVAARLRIASPGASGNGGGNGARALEIGVLSNHSCVGGHQTCLRVAQHRALAAWAAKVGGDLPLLVGGDFNFDGEPGGLHQRVFRMARRIPFARNPVSEDWDSDCAAMGELRAVMNDFGMSSGRTAGPPRLWKNILWPFGAPLYPLAWALGFPRMRSRLDYVFGSPQLALTEARVLRITGPHARGHEALKPGALPWMDHDPVLVRFSVRI